MRKCFHTTLSKFNLRRHTLAGADSTARQLALAGGAVAVALGLLRRNATGSAAGPANLFPRSSHAGCNVV